MLVINVFNAAVWVFVLYYNHAVRRGFCRGHLGESVRETNGAALCSPGLLLQNPLSLSLSLLLPLSLFFNGKCARAFLMFPRCIGSATPVWQLPFSSPPRIQPTATAPTLQTPSFPPIHNILMRNGAGDNTAGPCRKARLHGGGRTPAKKKKKKKMSPTPILPKFMPDAPRSPSLMQKELLDFFFFFFGGGVCLFVCLFKSLNDKVDIIFSAAPPDDHVRTVLCTFSYNPGQDILT